MITFVPNASSVIPISATLILDVVSVFSGRVVVVFVNPITVGASFTSVMASEKSTVIGELPDTPESKTLTVTA